MTSEAEARRQVMALLPSLPGWTVWTDVPAQGQSPPWVVVQFSENDRDQSEAAVTSLHIGVLDIRVVGESAESVGIVCDRLSRTLDGAWPGNGMSCLVPIRDSGAYSAELVSPLTGSPFSMRVLQWRVGWDA